MDFHRMSPHNVADSPIRFGDELETVGAFLHRHVGIRPERQFQDAAEDVGQPPELFVGPTAQQALSLGPRCSWYY
ncbi:hypothetical protein QQP08_012986 [Theobroma cacao]|nr:hypothetical protein QQP08_012986 [Theobroma cacao]